MRRTVLAVALVALSMALIVPFASAQEVPTNAEEAAIAALEGAPGSEQTTAAHVGVAPSSGNQNDTFTFAGAGFTGKALIDIRFVSPDGQEFQLATPEGNPAVWECSDAGEFQINIVPATSFTGAAPGTFKARFHDQSTDTIAELEFEITL